jgi:hypothetical protein
MELFGYVCSPLCKAKADSHGLSVPVYALQKSVLEAKLWRKVTWAAVSAGVLLCLALSAYVWYYFYGAKPTVVFSVRFPEAAHSGASIVAGKEQDQVVFLHGGTLARHDMKQKKAIWSRELVDTNAVRIQADKQLKEEKERIDRLSSDKPDLAASMKPMPLDKLIRYMIRAEEAALTLYVRGQNVWVASTKALVRYDWDSGKPLKELALQPELGDPITRGDEVLLLQMEAGAPVITHVNLASAEVRTEAIAKRTPTNAPPGTPGAPRPAMVAAGKGTAGNPATAGLPTTANSREARTAMDPSTVAAQAQRLSLPAQIALPATLSGSLGQERTLRELEEPGDYDEDDAPIGPRSGVSLVPTRDGVIEMTTKVLEERMVARSAMKAPGATSALESASVGNSTEMANELLNEMQRARGGDKVFEDLSRYEITLKQRKGTGSWSGEVIGPATLYPLQTVNVLAANKLIVVLDKNLKQLWKNPLSYTLAAPLGALEEADARFGLGPCAERKGSLYVFDPGVLSAFDLATGNARWRLPSVGIAGMFFDEQDNIYLNTTTASPQKLKYSRQIDISQKDVTVVLKLDSKDGKVLWSSQLGGLINYVSGKYVFMVQSYAADDDEDGSPYRVDTGFERLSYLRIRRLSPSNGRELWQIFEQRFPLDMAFDNDTIRLVFKKEVQVLKFARF